MKFRSYKYNTPLEITWLDIVEDSSWMSIQKALLYKPCLCKTVGFFLNQNDEVIRISGSIQVNDHDRNVIVIPWGCIKSIKVLK